MKIGIDLTELKKELNEVKKNNENKNEIIQKSVLDINNYQYINFTDDPEIDDFLNDKSFKILDLAAASSILLGSIFIEVQEYLADKVNSDTTYIKWLESNGFNRMTALRYKKRAEIYNSLKSSRAKYFIGVTSQRIIDEISKYEDRKEILYYLEEMNNYDEIENFLKKDVVLEIEDKTEKENIEIKSDEAERFMEVLHKKVPLEFPIDLDGEKPIFVAPLFYGNNIRGFIEVSRLSYSTSKSYNFEIFKVISDEINYNLQRIYNRNHRPYNKNYNSRDSPCLGSIQK